VQTKHLAKPPKAMEMRDLAPLEAVHSDLCEMKAVLTKCVKIYFMTFINDYTIFVLTKIKG